MKETKHNIQKDDGNYKKAEEHFKAIGTVTQAGSNNMTATDTHHIEVGNDDEPSANSDADVQLVRSLIQKQQNENNDAAEQTVRARTSNRNTIKMGNEASVNTSKKPIRQP